MGRAGLGSQLGRSLRPGCAIFAPEWLDSTHSAETAARREEIEQFCPRKTCMPVSEDRAGITAIATIFGAASAYLIIVGLIMLFRPGMVSMAAGSALLGGLET